VSGRYPTWDELASVTLSLSLTPAEVVSANGRLHWARKAGQVAEIRHRAAMSWRIEGRPRLDRAHCTVTIAYPDARARDVHNLMPTVKAAIDGFVHPGPGVRGLLPDDSDAYLVGPDMRHDAEVSGTGRYTFRFVFEEVADHA